MTEDEVNLYCKQWLVARGYHYKGVLNSKKANASRNNTKVKDNGFGQVPVPANGDKQVLLDHQGFRDDIPDLHWIEAKGSDVNLSELLEGFIRTVFAVFYGGGDGYLAVPHAEYEELLKHQDFLRAVAESVNGKGLMGLIDAEKAEDIIF